jgi:hypothetical protein
VFGECRVTSARLDAGLWLRPADSRAPLLCGLLHAFYQSDLSADQDGNAFSCCTSATTST